MLAPKKCLHHFWPRKEGNKGKVKKGSYVEHRGVLNCICLLWLETSSSILRFFSLWFGVFGFFFLGGVSLREQIIGVSIGCYVVCLWPLCALWGKKIPRRSVSQNIYQLKPIIHLGRNWYYDINLCM